MLLLGINLKVNEKVTKWTEVEQPQAIPFLLSQNTEIALTQKINLISQIQREHR